MSETDIFVLADNLQYVRKEWQNRQRFGERDEWLTVPLHRGHITDRIGDKRIANVFDWRRQHMAQLRRMLSGYSFYKEHAGFLEELYKRNWNTLSALNEATTRYLAKRIGIKDVLLIRASFAGEIPAEYKKDRYIAETVKRVAEGFMARPSCKVVHISGRCAHYLEEADEKGMLRKDRLLSERIDLKFPAYDSDVVKETWSINPFNSGLEVLCRLGSQAVNILKYFGQRAEGECKYSENHAKTRISFIDGKAVNKGNC